MNLKSQQSSNLKSQSLTIEINGERRPLIVENPSFGVGLRGWFVLWWDRIGTQRRDFFSEKEAREYHSSLRWLLNSPGEP